MDELLLQTRKFKVVRRLIENGNEAVSKELVIHPGGAAVLPIMNDGRVVMVRNYRWSINRELLELPAGTLAPLEDPEDCALRELEEETGFTAETITPLCRFYTSPGVATELIHVFVATGLHPGDQKLSRDERIKVEVMSFEEIDDALKNGKIMDGKTMAALLHYEMVGVG